MLPECRVRGAEAGVHVPLELPAGSDVTAIIAEAPVRGYGNLNDAAVDQAIAALAEIVRRS